MVSRFMVLIYSFFAPFFIRTKDYNLIVLRFDGYKFMFNTKVFFKYLLEHSDYDVKYIINDDQLRQQLKEKYGDHFITQKSFRDIDFISRAGTWITDGGFPLKTPFGHKNRVLINLWHGMPIKYIGLKGYSGLSKLRMLLQLKMYSKDYNAFCVTSKNFIPAIEESFFLPKAKIKVLGQPRNDLLFTKNDKETILSRLYSDLPDFSKAILYAPTYRSANYGSHQLEPTRFFPFDDLDMEQIEIFLEKQESIIFIRSHHLDTIDFSETKRIRFLNNDKVEDISEILNIFDLLVSDYSGMIYDYLLTENPMLFLPYDYDIYRESAGMYFDYDFVAPGPKPTDQKSFLAELGKLLNDHEYYSKERETLLNFAFDVVRDNSKRIYDFIQKEILEYEKE